MPKICNNCGKQVDDNVKFCPDCKCQTFRNLNEITAPDNSLIHKLFYWNYGGYYMLSKSKIAGIATFLIVGVFGLLSGAPAAVIIIAVIFAALVFLIFFAIHMSLPDPQKPKIIHNDYGLIQDLKHFLFYWQNKQGGFVFSKTKAISILVFILFFLFAMMIPNPNLFAAVIIGLIFETPVFAIGYAIHKLVNPNPQANPEPKTIPKQKEIKKPKLTQKIETPKDTTIPEFIKYETQINDLKSEFDEKEKNTRDLIEKRFAPPQITYTKFITVVDKSSQLFNTQASNALTMINLAGDASPKIENEIISKIDILKSIINKLDDLKNELVLNMGESNHDDVNNLFDEMSDLIDSVKEYEN